MCTSLSFRLGNLTLDGNLLQGRAPGSICDLRDNDLVEFLVDCPIRVGAAIEGVICGVPTCCSNCRPADF
jgi:hypothetical protein